MILVTGASRGLGQAISQRLLENGHKVIGVSRNKSSSANFQILEADVGNFEELKLIAKELRRNKVELKGVINAAGIASMNLALMAPPENVAKVINTNLLGTIYSCQAFAPLIIRSGGGSIINFSTIAVKLGLEGEAVYAASKSGVEAFSRVLARELSAHNIRVNSIAPGPIKTDLLRGVSDEQIFRITERQVIRKSFQPSDVCDVVELLLSPLSSSISGQVLSIGGS